MKNVIMGIVGGFLIVYAVVLSLSVYGMQSRENELNNHLSAVVVEVLENNYAPSGIRIDGKTARSNQEIQKEVEEELRLRIHSDTDVKVSILACDMNMGILSVKVEEEYKTPCGNRTFVRQKTAIVERE